jgi:ADP-ribose pyrophosphatase YjhB (NUDIX family)
MRNKILKIKDTEIEVLFSRGCKKNKNTKVLVLNNLELENVRLRFKKFLESLNEKTKFVSIFVSPKDKLNKNTVVSAAKVVVEEITRFVLENKNLIIQKIFIVLRDKKIYNIFSKIIPDHVGYINRKIGLYPIPTVDIIIEVNTKHKKGIVLVERKNPPYGWAIPGGFVEYNESLETAAVREAKEETGLKIKNLRQFHTYSQPGRDPRFHTISTVFIAEADSLPKAASDAKNVVVATKEEILSGKYNLVFDHKEILQDYFKFKEGKII